MNGIELPLWAAIPTAVLLVAGGLLALLGALGLLRLQEFYARIHPPAMASTLGTGCVLLASMLQSSALQQRPVLHEILIGVFIVLSAPVSSMLLMRAAVARGGKHEHGPPR